MSADNRCCIQAEPLSQRAIAAIAGALFSKYCDRVGDSEVKQRGIIFRRMFDEIIAPEYGISLVDGIPLGNSIDGRPLLGLYDIETNTAYIDTAIGPHSNDPRRTFTLWHEVGGHGVLQGEHLRKQFRQGDAASKVQTTSASIASTTRNLLERQANIFAAHAAAPVCLVRAQIQNSMRLNHRIEFTKPSMYNLQKHGGTIECWIDSYEALCSAVARIIQPYFGGLSVEAIGYQVRLTELVVDKSAKASRSGWMPCSPRSRRPSTQDPFLQRVA